MDMDIYIYEIKLFENGSNLVLAHPLRSRAYECLLGL